MTLAELLPAVPEAQVQGMVDRRVNGLRYDSRQVRQGDVFFAWRGQNTDGHLHIPDACQRGVAAVVYESDNLVLSSGPTYIRVKNARASLARMADIFYGQPSRALTIIGITGTNGKTTTAFVTKYLLEKMGHKVGLLGTVRYEVGQRMLRAARTTPEGSELHELLAMMREEDCTAVVMEVSSHALDQGRVAGVAYEVGVFTNLTPDHLDYHQTMEHYFESKRRLFTHLVESDRPSTAVINFDDAYGRQILTDMTSPVRAISYSAGGDERALLRAENMVMQASGTALNLLWAGQTHPVIIPLLGRFNVANVLAAIGSVMGLGLEFTEVLPHLSGLQGVPGRLERFVSPRGYTVVVDYAHTADALENVLTTLRQLKPNRLITVVGCGGNRDKQKRPVMASAATRLSDRVIFTADNPRDEEITAIFADMQAGIESSVASQWEPSRKEAIKLALQSAQAGDLVCIAGKGHESTQEIKGVFHPFDDREMVQAIISGEGK
jgi:UDP-N-acetylmuramoyl-L-alanyl-D-glutamate--2,6-diaminopimelate ligase